MESFHPVRLSCIVLVLHILTKLFADMTSWSVSHVLEFAQSAGLDNDDLKHLKEAKVTGATLANKDIEFFIRFCGLTPGADLLIVAWDAHLQCMLLRFTPHVVPHYTDLVFLFALSCVLSCSL